MMYNQPISCRVICMHLCKAYDISKKHIIIFMNVLHIREFCRACLMLGVTLYSSDKNT